MCRSHLLSLFFLSFLAAITGCSGNGKPPTPPSPGPHPREVVDEARLAGRAAASFPAADEDYFHDMDGGGNLTKSQIIGRNNWIVWTGGNDHLWDDLTLKSVGNFDLLKTISSYPYPKGSKLPSYGRHNRWWYLGLVNEPCFKEAKGPNPDRHGLWLDTRQADCPADPFENEAKYPGVKLRARGKNLPAGSFYGYATGIVGLRLFPNPDFDEKAAKAWDPKRYYSDPSYYLRKDLIRPYRVGMACAFCHVGPSPVHPPADPENPTWADLSSNVGAQYFWIDRIFSWDADVSSFPYQLFHTSRPGALDTSLVSTDYINNPRTMNAVYGLNSRLALAKRWGKETLAGGEKDNKQFNDYFPSGPLTELFQKPDTVLTTRVLKDGSDAVGALGALNRVYINIGLFSEEWQRHFNPLVGGKPISPIEVKVGRANSSFWQATEAQTPSVADFFLATTAPHLLKDAPGGAAYLKADSEQLTRGKVVFAETCARCHSSKLPESLPGLDPGGCAGPGYLDCWNKYWAYTKTEEFKKQMREIVLKDDFLKDNYLSNETRVPVTLLETNACSPLATNAIANNIWDNYSSHSYKSLPSVGTITVHNPFTGEPRQYTMPAGGRGYTRPASLLSLWSTAPYLQNNTVGLFNGDPSVKGRMAAFEDGIEKMLWPEKREKDPVLGDKIPGPSKIDRTTAPSYLRVPVGYLPPFAPDLAPLVKKLAPSVVGKGGIEIGPIPKVTPVNLLSNIDLRPDNESLGERAAHDKELLDLLITVTKALKALPANATDEQARAVFRNAKFKGRSLADQMLDLSKCPDFVVNRGHYFGTDRFKEEPGLSDADKRALIEFLKTF
ncbi:MAG: hypothetical protein DMF53_06355 [Acidobacteria bacterium]|nr:MAG: hypothetical protein DMF53_06355 [Acidobacteriota bacterium]